jgi:hypothetical protein
VKKALATIVAAAALVVLFVPAADATLDRSVPTTYSHTKATKAAKNSTNAKHAAQATSIFVPFVVICPEQDPGDSWGYCITVPSQSDTGTQAPTARQAASATTPEPARDVLAGKDSRRRPLPTSTEWAVKGSN